ncbi:(-)-germacrene D synthase [Acorus calamus]|uniref:(-)-germacrene D synthase n=1 Tax=Acorus calamus TaxID=4465 RepID=A0AAV9FCH8_ACOCL|nr:(-)-germacrene D synthase [Acorus calamus]
MASVLQHPLILKKEPIVRKSANFPPSYWGDFFASLVPSNVDSSVEERVEELKTEVKKMISHANGAAQKLDVIDAVQRLGLAYHFEEEVDEALKQINDACIYDDDLHSFALRFRLLRQQGYNTPSDGFKKFTNEKMKFKESLSSDGRGLLSLYEAAHLGLPGEEILDEAIAFAGQHLKLIKDQVSESLSMDIERALDIPLRRGMARLQARHYIDVYERDDQRCDALLQLAKLDFNRVQCLLQKELKAISVWWKDLGLIKELNFARDRLVECYFWILGVCHETHQSRSRSVMAKVLVLLSVMDDIYDVHGIMDELIPFNDVIQREDMVHTETMKHLPEYMQIFVHALADSYIEIEKELSLDGNSYRMDYLKDMVCFLIKLMARSYLQEAIWGGDKYIPTFKEHLQLSLLSCGYPALHCVALVGATKEEHVTKEALDWVISVPRITHSAALICRLMDDIYDLNQDKDGQVISCTKCYILENGLTQDEANLEFQRMIEEAWKTINQELLLTTLCFPVRVISPALDLACMMEVIYKKADTYNKPDGEMKDRITMLLLNPIPV